MPNSPRWSNGSAVCRLEWRPSRCLLGALLSLGLMAAWAVLASEMPRRLAWPLAALSALEGVRLARREWRRPRCRLVFSGDAAPVLLDGRPLDRAGLQWRGPLAFLRWRDRNGRWRHLCWWPDTLPPALRRELRLAATDGGARER